MNRQLITLAFIAITSIAIVTGCKSLPQVQNQQALITAAASIGTSYDLSQRPSDLPYFVAAEQELYSVANSTNAVTQTTIQNILSGAGETNNSVNMAISVALSLGNQLIAANTSNSNTNAVIIKDVCGWTADGIGSVVNAKLATIKYIKK